MKNKIEMEHNVAVVSFNKCLKCEHNKGRRGTFLICGCHGEFNVTFPVLPSFYNKGFKNGELVVECPLKKPLNKV